jgi:hypothetical protein
MRHKPSHHAAGGCSGGFPVPVETQVKQGDEGRVRDVLPGGMTLGPGEHYSQGSSGKPRKTGAG